MIGSCFQWHSLAIVAKHFFADGEEIISRQSSTSAAHVYHRIQSPFSSITFSSGFCFQMNFYLAVKNHMNSIEKKPPLTHAHTEVFFVEEHRCMKLRLR